IIPITHICLNVLLFPHHTTASFTYYSPITPQSLLFIIPPSHRMGNTTDVNLNITLDINDIISNNSDVTEGGEWRPPSCISRHRVAVIIPYRDRFSHLKVLLHYLIPLLKRQQIHFRIFIVEQ
ncbi:unnamed protein product, partial [Candidula unifasciata]